MVACGGCGTPAPPAPFPIDDPFAEDTCLGDQVVCDAPAAGSIDVEDIAPVLSCDPELVALDSAWSFSPEGLSETNFPYATAPRVGASGALVLQFWEWQITPERDHVLVFASEGDEPVRVLTAEWDTRRVSHARLDARDRVSFVVRGPPEYPAPVNPMMELRRADAGGEQVLFEHVGSFDYDITDEDLFVMSDGRSVVAMESDGHIRWRQTALWSDAPEADVRSVHVRDDGSVLVGVWIDFGDSRVALLDARGNVVATWMFPGQLVRSAALPDGGVAIASIDRVAAMGADGTWQWAVQVPGFARGVAGSDGGIIVEYTTPHPHQDADILWLERIARDGHACHTAEISMCYEFCTGGISPAAEGVYWSSYSLVRRDVFPD